MLEYILHGFMQPAIVEVHNLCISSSGGSNYACTRCCSGRGVRLQQGNLVVTGEIMHVGWCF